MISNLFCRNDITRSAEFKKDLQVLIELETKAFHEIPPFALAALESQSKQAAERVYDQASERTGLPRAQLDHVMDIAQFFLREFAPKGDAEKDEPEVIVADLAEFLPIPKDKYDCFRTFLAKLKEAASHEARAIILQRVHEQSVLPRLASISVAVDFRGVFDDYYKSTDDITKFVPQCKGFVPLGIVQIGLEDSNTEQVAFQLSKRTLQILI
ncbi:MAG: hypothetical protein NTX50_17395, partial [Candidatus Sumerlaeota bacterium]|nr:hypothetical protein [Candidatus Sumerlaeota bacterium]